MLWLSLIGLAASADLLFSGGRWAAVRTSGECEAIGRPLAPASERDMQARAGFGWGGQRQGEFFVRLSREPKAGSTVLLKVGSQPFLLVSRGAWAWSRGPAHDRAIMATLRREQAMRIEARDARGRRFVDLYLLAGAPTAVDAAAAGCAGKI